MNETCNVTTALSAFSSISLEEMSTIRLMNRTDTKYIVSLSARMEEKSFFAIMPGMSCLP